VGNEHKYKYHPFKIRTLSDQRFLAAWTVVSLLISICLTGAIATKTYVENFISSYGSSLDPDNKVVPTAPQIPPWKVFGTDKLTFILLGYDEVDQFAHRSDTLMVGAVDFIARKVNVLSIPRDTLVQIPRHGYQKVNAAYSLGHDDLVLQTVENFTGVDIDYVIAVNYEGFVEVVDALGGVDVTIDRAMNYDDRRGNLHIHFEPGDHHLDGQKALELARFRKYHRGDLERIEMQQMLLRTLIDQAIKPQNIFNLNPAAKAIVDNISITINDESPRKVPEILDQRPVLSLLGFVKELDGDDITFYTLPTTDIMYEGLSSLIPQYSNMRIMLDEVFTDDAPVGWDNIDFEFVQSSVSGLENALSIDGEIEE
jgi:LCP family protein required for cell wall assembly